MSSELFFQVATNGLIAGSNIALLAVSYALIYSVLRFINFLFGELLMLSALSFYFLKAQLGLPAVFAAGLVIVILGLVGTALQIAAYRPFYRRSRLACLITALGISVILQNIALVAFEGAPFALTFSGSFGPIGGISVTYVQMATFAAAIFLLWITDRLVFHSNVGLRFRALADNLAMAELLGINVNSTIAGVFGLGSCLAAGTGVLFSLEHLIQPTMGNTPGVQAFAACVVGGIGSIRGAVVAAFGIAIAGNFVSFALPTVAPETTAYAALLSALWLSPEGLGALSVKIGHARRRTPAAGARHRGPI